MKTDLLLSKTFATSQQPASTRWGASAHIVVALVCAALLLASWGIVMAASAAASQNEPLAEPPHTRQTQGDLTTWGDFHPTAWVTIVPLASGITASDPAGLVPSTAAFRTSTDGGVSWGAWSQAGLAATPVSSSTVTLAVAAVTFPDSQSNNRIQFRINLQTGSTQTSPAYTIRVDTVAPGSPLNLQSFPDAWTNSNSFRETWTNPADTSGIAGAYYRIDSEPLSAHDGVFVPNPNQIDGISVPSEGAHSLLLWLIDEAGNVDHRTYRVDWQAFKYDATAPTVGVSRQGPLGQNGWYTGTVTLAFAPVDPLSGVAGWSWRLDNQPPSSVTSTVVVTDALHTLVLSATDRAGNVMRPVTTTLPIDAGRPAISHTLSPAPTATGWYTAPVTVTLGLTDPVSGPGAILWRLDNGAQTAGSQVRVLFDGLHTVSAYGRDQAGNRSSTLQLNLPVDAHAPKTTLTLGPGHPGASGFYSSTVTGSWSATDAITQPVPGPGSGVLATRMKIDAGPWQTAAPFTLAASGIHRVHYASQDRAGNVELTHTRVISIDVTPPGAPIAPVVEPATWSSANQFAVSWQNPADLSGIVGARIFLGQGPPPAGSGVFHLGATQIGHLSAPGEGVWPVWMALRDAAGNTGGFVSAGTLRYDRTPPQVQAQLTGPAGQAGWYVGPVQATLTIADAGSGPALLRYRVDGGQWQESTTAQVVLPISAAGRHVVDFAGQDQAGLISGPFMRAVRIDADAPGPPVAAVASPEAWTPTNAFTLTWRNPFDTSGVTTAYTSFDPPVGPRDGQSVSAAGQSTTIQAPAEGVHDVYLWLEDTAGNASISQVARLPGALRYDPAAPTLQFQLSPQPNAAGWARSAVAVTLAVADPLSGVASTTWELDGQAPVSGTQFTVRGDGAHRVVARSTDHAGNASEANQTIRIDTQAPLARLFPLSGYSASTEVSVMWEGSDLAAEDDEEINASGLDTFEVQVRIGAGSWQSWLPDTDETHAVYNGQRGQRLAFRVRSLDHAGNASPWMTAGGANTVFIDPIVNGAFGTLNWNGWNTVDGLQMAIVQEQELYPGLTVPAARLGSPLYQACAASGPNMLPTPLCGDTWSGVSQTIAVPGLDVVPEPTLEVWYRVRTYDQITTTSTIWNQLCPITPPPSYRLVDSFDVTAQVSGAPTADVLVRDGNRQPQFPLPIEQRDSGWKLATVDLSPYAGRTITLDIASHNRLDNRFNTWTDITGVKLRGSQRRVFLPLVPNAVGAEPEPPPVCWPNGAGPGLASPVADAPPAGEITEGSLR